MSKQKNITINTAIIVFFLGIFFVILYFQPPHVPTPINYKNVTITLERTACEGTCPIYKLTIDGNGKVSYEGKEFVKVIGSQTAQITPQEVADLVKKFYAINFFSLRDKYTDRITDLPTKIVSITIDGRTKRVEDYFGAPKELRELENTIDQVARSSKWVKK